MAIPYSIFRIHQLRTFKEIATKREGRVVVIKFQMPGATDSAENEVVFDGEVGLGAWLGLERGIVHDRDRSQVAAACGEILVSGIIDTQRGARPNGCLGTDRRARDQRPRQHGSDAAGEDAAGGFPGV